MRLSTQVQKSLKIFITQLLIGNWVVRAFAVKNQFKKFARCDGWGLTDNYSIQYVEGKFWANNHVHVVCGTQVVNTRFLYHYLSVVNFVPFLTGGVRAKLTKGSMVEIQIPIPCPDNPKKSLEIQAEIVQILDKFDALTNSITEGLPREIELRQKQYEHYRDKLLRFGSRKNT